MRISLACALITKNASPHPQLTPHGPLGSHLCLWQDKKKAGMHPIAFHLCAIVGCAHIAWSAMAMCSAYYGNDRLQKLTALIYGTWLACIAMVQYTHPWTGSAPESIMEMPMPLILVAATLVGGSAYMTFSAPAKGKKK